MTIDFNEITEMALGNGVSLAVRDVHELPDWLNLPFLLADNSKEIDNSRKGKDQLPLLFNWIDKLHERSDYEAIEDEFIRIGKALESLSQLKHMAVYGLIIMNQFMFKFSMKDMPDPIIEKYMTHEILSSEEKYNELRDLTADYCRKFKNNGVMYPLGTSHYNCFTTSFKNFQRHFTETIIVTQAQTNRFFTILRKFSSSHEKMKRIVDWSIAIRFAKNPKAANLLKLHKELDPSYTIGRIAQEIMPTLGTHKPYDSKLASTLFKNPSSLDFIEAGIGYKAFTEYQMTGLSRSITTQQSGFMPFCWVMLECAEREPSIDREQLAAGLMPRFHTAFSQNENFSAICLKAKALLPLTRDQQLVLSTCIAAANSKTHIGEHDKAKDDREMKLCLAEMDKLKIAGVGLKASTRVAVMIAMGMQSELDKDSLLKRKSLEQDLGL